MKKIRIEKAADLEDLWGGQHEFEWAVYFDEEPIGAGHTCAEAVAEARETFRTWRRSTPSGTAAA